MGVSAESSCWVDSGGVRLHVRIDEPARAEGRPVVVLHGFTGSARSMAGVVRALGERHPLVRLDLVGHGESEAPSDPDAYTMERCVDQVRGVIDALGLPRPHLLGYSMGGRVALSLCAALPGFVTSAVLVGASAGLADSRARARRRADDEGLAQRILDEGIEGFVDAWMAHPLFASQKRLGPVALAEAREQRLACRPRGLVDSLRGMGTGAMPALHARLPCVHVPVCLMAGDEDPKFSDLARELAAALPAGEARVVAESGHAVHLEQPDAFARLALEFFRRTEAASLPETFKQE